MTPQDHRLNRLQKVAALMADRALQPVAAARADMQRIEARIERIAQHRAALMTAAGEPAIAATMLRQAERLRREQAAALSDLARARIRLDAARRAAAQAVGRDQALTELARRRRAAAALEARRRKLR